MATSYPLENFELIRFTESAFDGKYQGGITDGFRLRRDDKQQQCSVYWGKQNLSKFKFELALSPVLSIGNKSNLQVIEWIEAEIAERDARGAKHKGSASWPTIGFATQGDYLLFLDKIFGLRLNAQATPYTKSDSKNFPTLDSVPNSRLARLSAWLAGGNSSTVAVRQKAERIGQRLLRRHLLSTSTGRCSLTGISTVRILRASHIKPWSQSNDSERLDPDNALLLSPNADAAFDSGFISFSDEGVLVVSPDIAAVDLKLLGLQDKMRLRHQPNTKQALYLKWHREKILRVAVAA